MRVSACGEARTFLVCEAEIQHFGFLNIFLIFASASSRVGGGGGSLILFFVLIGDSQFILFYPWKKVE
jgi:hypothetical protein